MAREYTTAQFGVLGVTVLGEKDITACLWKGKPKPVPARRSGLARLLDTDIQDQPIVGSNLTPIGARNGNWKGYLSQVAQKSCSRK